MNIMIMSSSATSITSAPGTQEYFNECRAVYLNQPLEVVTSKRPFDLIRALRKARKERQPTEEQAASSSEESCSPATDTASGMSTACESASTIQGHAIKIFGEDASKKKTTLEELMEVPTDEQLADDDFEPVTLVKRVPLSMVVAAAAKNWADLPEM